MASILLIHGASHQPAHFTTLIAALEARGRQVVCPALPTSGDKTADMHSDARIITSALTGLLDAGKQVVVVAHSYGGMPTTQALTASTSSTVRAQQGLPGGVVHLVYMAAMLPLHGMTMLDAVLDDSADGSGVHNQPPPPAVLAAMNEGAPKGFLWQRDPASTYYSDVAPVEAVQDAVAKLRFQSQRSVVVPLSNEGWRYVPVTYCVCTRDVVLPEPVQRKMVGWVDAAVRVVEIAAGHSPWMMHLETVRDVILNVGE